MEQLGENFFKNEKHIIPLKKVAYVGFRSRVQPDNEKQIMCCDVLMDNNKSIVLEGEEVKSFTSLYTAFLLKQGCN